MKGIPPPRTVGLFLSSLLILISLLRSEGGMGGLAVCTKPLLAGRDGFPVAEPVWVLFMLAAAAAADAAASACFVAVRKVTISF